MHAPRKDNKLMEWLLRSRFFLGAFLMHLLLFIVIGSAVVFKGYIKPTDVFDGFIEGGGDGAPPPPAAQNNVEVQEKSVEVSITAPSPNSAADILAVDSNDPTAFKMNIAPVPIQNNIGIAPSAGTQAKVEVAKGGFESRASDIKEFTKGWGGGGTGGTGGAQGKGTSLKAEFVCYVAKYADGDWNYNSYTAIKLNTRYKRYDATRALVTDDITAGAIPNLMRFLNVASHGRVVAKVIGKPLDLASTEIFEKRPPFIYFTGHKDFKLTTTEVENLRKYLIRGGAIWGDNALSGRGSRFDVAFRREMKKVIPDDDKPFKVIPDNHPMFINSFFPLKGAPGGMNYCQEPLEMIEMDGFLAVLYTPNNYGELMTVILKTGSNKLEIDWNGAPDRMGSNWAYKDWRTRDFYRNIDAESVQESFQMGTNIIEHLLTRFQDRLQFAN